MVRTNPEFFNKEATKGLKMGINQDEFGTEGGELMSKLLFGVNIVSTIDLSQMFYLLNVKNWEQTMEEFNRSYVNLSKDLSDLKTSADEFFTDLQNLKSFETPVLELMKEIQEIFDHGINSNYLKNHIYCQNDSKTFNLNSLEQVGRCYTAICRERHGPDFN